MDITSLLIFLAIGAIAGWIAGSVMKGKGYGIIGNMVIGIVGAVVGGFIFGLLGISAGGLIGTLITATVGAIALIFVVQLIKKA
ncbi:MAG: GlsB/YeaQ/YmgE family stress response membrane protein [Gammaproteobacteria bacterium]|jgi:uncharacterized membrane protein YeaQ/YmgE (transglycosylase-associated protein family)|nr:GlsB/YeaQ/YmgE family stress response membrane protein [Gammaproteobacteria bacterium]HUV21237.1 GlsB/YeaQ/YmgE family stress response membrane protein [Gammaproteobacteria bacterium]